MPVTVAALVADAAARLERSGSTSPRLDAELLLAFALNVDRVGVLAHPDAPVPQSAADAFEGYAARRELGEPVAYIRGFREFHGVAISTDPRALVPRPETEELVDEAVADIARRLTATSRSAGTPPLRVADVGTGSGAIAIAIVAALRRRRMDAHIEVTAVDISPDALDLAKENAVGQGVADRMAFRVGDLLDGGEVPYDVVCANLPYVASGAIDGLGPELRFEPRGALDGGPDGLDVIRRLLDRLPHVLESRGTAFLEIGSDQGDRVVAEAASRLAGWRCVVLSDLAGLPRVARLERTAPEAAA
jgi:release factor glutamine methyltransferase